MTVPASAASEFGRDRTREASAAGSDSSYHRHHRYRRGGIDGGDILAGILVLGGAFAIAKAIENDRDVRPDRAEERYPDVDERHAHDHDRDKTDHRDQYAARSGIDNAIEDCVEEVEAGRRVQAVSRVDRNGSDWVVEGETTRGTFSCTMDAHGRIVDIDYDEAGPSYRAATDVNSPVGSQYEDDYYSEARRRAPQSGPEPRVKQENAGTRAWERGEPDDRYET